MLLRFSELGDDFRSASFRSLLLGRFVEGACEGCLGTVMTWVRAVTSDLKGEHESGKLSIRRRASHTFRRWQASQARLVLAVDMMCSRNEKTPTCLREKAMGG